MLLTLVAEAEEKATLFMPNWAFPLIAASLFLLFALISWNFRDVANRHADKTGGNAPDRDQHGGEGHH